MIGIVGGVGPYAGLDLLHKLLDNTLANSDQEHLDTVLLSLPSGIMDRTEYLLGKEKENPAFAIAEVLLKLEKTGAKVAGIPCNTAHAEGIFNIIQDVLHRAGSSIEVLHMINETVSFIAATFPDITRVGVLSTTGTYLSGVYNKALKLKDYEVLIPTMEMQETVIHPAMYDPVYGIKAVANPVHPMARENLLRGFSYLKKQGAEAVILGCTEIPIAIPEPKVEDVVTIDPTFVLARALIFRANPEKLRP
ncbi:MAG: aspartate/glutamate racemase family protein [Bacteroidales bacterium]|nr:aspartate/glutamate racemase family protein [Bacteroidales bacterium]